MAITNIERETFEKKYNLNILFMVEKNIKNKKKNKQKSIKEAQKFF